jgi:predicted DNA-binding transcriptional regulator AlpA
MNGSGWSWSQVEENRLGHFFVLKTMEEEAMKQLLNEKEVEQVFGLNRRTLQRWRVTGEGPCFIRANRSIRYAVKDIEDFLSVRKHSSTSEYALETTGCRNEASRVERACAPEPRESVGRKE